MGQVSWMRMAKAWPLTKATEKTEEKHFHMSVSKGHHKNSSRCCYIAPVQISAQINWKMRENDYTIVMPLFRPGWYLLSWGTHREHMKLPQNFCIRLSAEKPSFLSQGSDPNLTNACRVPFMPCLTPRGLGKCVLTCSQPKWGTGGAQCSIMLQEALKWSTMLRTQVCHCTSRSGCHDSAFSFPSLFWLVTLPYILL